MPLPVIRIDPSLHDDAGAWRFVAMQPIPSHWLAVAVQAQGDDPHFVVRAIEASDLHRIAPTRAGHSAAAANGGVDQQAPGRAGPRRAGRGRRMTATHRFPMLTVSLDLMTWWRLILSRRAWPLRRGRKPSRAWRRPGRSLRPATMVESPWAVFRSHYHPILHNYCNLLTVSLDTWALPRRRSLGFPEESGLTKSEGLARMLLSSLCSSPLRRLIV